MLGKPTLYGLELVVDMQNSPQMTESGTTMLDPKSAVITAAGVSTPDGDVLHRGSESDILRRLDEHFAALRPGIIATWNGSTLDLPLLEARASTLRVNVGLRVQPDRRQNLRLVGTSDVGARRPLVGAWHRQRHLDLNWLGTNRDNPNGPSAIQDPCRDALAARTAANQRWKRALRHLERMPPPAALNNAVWDPFGDPFDSEDDSFDDSYENVRREVPAEAIRRHPSAGSRLA